MTAYFWRSKEKVLSWHQTATPGARLLYFVGDLIAARLDTAKGNPTAQAVEISALADLVMNMHMEGLLDLRQTRLDEGIKAYFCYAICGDGVELALSSPTIDVKTLKALWHIADSRIASVRKRA